MLGKSQPKLKLVLMAGLLLVCSLGGSCVTDRSFDRQLSSIVEPHKFSITGWEFNALWEEAINAISGKDKETYDEVGKVMEYSSIYEQIKTMRSEIKTAKSGDTPDNLTSLEAELNRLQEQKLALTDTVEKIIEKQVREILSDEGIYNPLISLKANFPPVNFKLEKPPYLLVISPRDRIESMRTITLRQSISLEDMESIEDEVDKLGVSSLVVNLGGLAAYPTIVTDDADLRFIIDTAVHEWLHQYLAFKPLGFRYFLDSVGISRNYDIATMNETLAGIVSKEIGSVIFEKYYPGYEDRTNQNQTSESDFDFNLEMRETRRTVDMYLAQGQIESAEVFMEQKRQYLASRGHYIRKLNQAYFAFHGTYADSPTSVSPIGLELKKLREQSSSLKNFLSTVAAMTRRQELEDSIK